MPPVTPQPIWLLHGGQHTANRPLPQAPRHRQDQPLVPIVAKGVTAVTNARLVARLAVAVA